MPTREPGELTAVSIAALDGGAIAEAVVDERQQCFARLHADGAWSGWLLVADGVTDVSVTAGSGQDEPTALIAVIILVPLPLGAYAVSHTLHQDAFFRLSASGIVPADL
jgi:hypothetical protein